MKATIVLIADNDAENYGRKWMPEANRHGKMGIEMSNGKTTTACFLESSHL